MQGSWKDKDKNIIRDKLGWYTKDNNPSLTTSIRSTTINYPKAYRYAKLYGWLMVYNKESLDTHKTKTSQDVYSDKELRDFKGKINLNKKDFVLHEDNKPKFELEYDWADEFVYDHSAPDDWEDYSDTSLGGYCEYNDTYSWHEDWYE